MTIICSESITEDLRNFRAWKPIRALIAEDSTFKQAAEISHTENGVTNDKIILQAVEPEPVRGSAAYMPGHYLWHDYSVVDIQEERLRVLWRA